MVGVAAGAVGEPGLVRLMGLETEYGIVGAQAAQVVEACLEVARREGRSQGVRWDYSGEYPLRDARGLDADPGAVSPSAPADDPAGRADCAGRADRPGAATAGTSTVHVSGGLGGPGPRTSVVPRLTAQEEAWQRGTATCLPNGGRLYVDHGHPEYATPECTGAAQTVLADRAGELLLTRAAALLGDEGVPVRLFRNNVDGKGATYGTHENYLVPRDVAFCDLVEALVPFLVTRPVLVGSGRVGTGTVSTGTRFQLAQRADYLERVVGLGTTVDRPLVNTRDEPHADPRQWRRLHVVAGDASCFDTIAWLKLGMTSLVLQALADGLPRAWRDLALADPVAQARAVSYDTGLSQPLELADGRRLGALDVQRTYLEEVRSHLLRHGAEVPEPRDPLAPDLGRLADGLDLGGRETGALLAFWQASLEALDARQAGQPGAAGHLEWVAKQELVEATAARHPGQQGEAVLHAVDLAWSELSEQGRALSARVPAGAAARRLLSAGTVADALDTPPPTTRAWLRGRLVERLGSQVVAAGWHSMVLETGEKDQRRLPLTDPLAWTRREVGQVVEEATSAREVLEALTGEELPAAGPRPDSHQVVAGQASPDGGWLTNRQWVADGQAADSKPGSTQLTHDDRR